MFGWVVVHLEVIVQAGLTVEGPAAGLTPPAASPALQAPGVSLQEARRAPLTGGHQVLATLQVQPQVEQEGLDIWSCVAADLTDGVSSSLHHLHQVGNIGQAALHPPLQHHSASGGKES